MALCEKNIVLVCPKCLKGKFQGVFLCPECGAEFPSEFSVPDLRIVKVDEKNGWNALAFDEIYSKCHFPNSTDDFKILGIPEFAEKYRLAQRDILISGFFAKFAPEIILDSGCGDGCFTGKIAKLLPESFIYGVDVSTFRIGRLLGKIASGNTKMVAIAANSEHLPFEDSIFDAVLMREVLEHFYNPLKALEEASRVLRPGGHLILTTPSKMMFYFWLAVAFIPSLLRRLITGRNILGNACKKAYDEPVSVSELRNFFQTTGFEVVSWEKVIFLPHESYLQFFPEFILKLLIFSAEIIKKLPFLHFTGLHHIIVLRKC